LCAASSGTVRPTSPSIICLPGEDISRRGTPHILRVGTPRTPRADGPSIIRLPSAPPQPPSRAQVLRVGTPRAVEPTPAPEPRSHTPTFIQIPGQPQAPIRSHTIRVGGRTPVFSPPLPAPPVERPRPEYAPPTPSVIQLPGQTRKPPRSQTIRVGTPLRQEFAMPTPAPAPAPAPTPVPAQPSIIQLPGAGMTVGPQTIRVASPTPSVPHFPESVIRLPERDDRHSPRRNHTVHVGSPPVQPLSPSIIRVPGGRDVPERVPTSQLVRVGGAVPQPSVIPTSAPSYAPPAEQIIHLPSAPVPQPPVTPSYVRVGGQPTIIPESR
jgi:hypothetical protein